VLGSQSTSLISGLLAASHKATACRLSIPVVKFSARSVIAVEAATPRWRGSRQIEPILKEVQPPHSLQTRSADDRFLAPTE
jgi:hypothetical protein